MVSLTLIEKQENVTFETLPNELIETVLSFLSSKELTVLSIVSSTWRESARIIYRKRIHEVFGKGGQHRYVFEASQPSEVIQGMVLELPEASRTDTRAAFQDDFTIFEFPIKDTDSNKYSFVLDDMFIQLCILGNVIETRHGGGLQGVAPHLDNFCRVKHDNMTQLVGSKQRFKISDQAFLVTKLLKREVLRESSGHQDPDDEGPVRYLIEYDRLLVNSAHVLRALELYQASTASSTSLVIRPFLDQHH